MKITDRIRSIFRRGPNSAPIRRHRRAVARGFSRSILSAEKTGRLESTWAVTPEEIDTYIYTHWKKLVARARNEARGGDHARKFTQLCRDNIAGPVGFTLRSQVAYPDGRPDKAAGDAIIDAYAEWSRRENFSVTGQFSRTAFERLAAPAWARDGEFIAAIHRGASAGPWGFAIQIIDPIRLDPTHCEQFPDGRFIKHGIEFSPLGRPLRYHFLKEPPGARIFATTQSVAYSTERVIIPAADVIHLFIPEYAGQKRGLSMMISALARLRTLQNYEDAALVNADIGARKAGFFRDPNPPDFDEDDGTPAPQPDLPVDAEAGVFEDIGNREFVPFDPDYPASEYEPFTKAVLRAISCGLNVSYNNLASDLTSVNFSSIRQGALDEREVWKGLQQAFIEIVCERLFRAWLEHSLINGLIRVGNTSLNPALLKKYQACVFTGRRWGWIDPASEVSAAEKSINLKLKSRSQIMHDWGLDPWGTWQEIATENEDMESLGLDPAVNLPGSAPTPAGDAGSDDADDGDDDGEEKPDAPKPGNPVKSPDKNSSAKSQTGGAQSESEPGEILAVKLGVGGTTALVSVVTNPDLSAQQKKDTMVILFGLPDADAEKLAGS